MNHQNLELETAVLAPVPMLALDNVPLARDSPQDYLIAIYNELHTWFSELGYQAVPQGPWSCTWAIPETQTYLSLRTHEPINFERHDASPDAFSPARLTIRSEAPKRIWLDSAYCVALSFVWETCPGGPLIKVTPSRYPEKWFFQPSEFFAWLKQWISDNLP